MVVNRPWFTMLKRLWTYDSYTIIVTAVTSLIFYELSLIEHGFPSGWHHGILPLWSWLVPARSWLGYPLLRRADQPGPPGERCWIGNHDQTIPGTWQWWWVAPQRQKQPSQETDKGTDKLVVETQKNMEKLHGIWCDGVYKNELLQRQEDRNGAQLMQTAWCNSWLGSEHNRRLATCWCWSFYSCRSFTQRSQLATVYVHWYTRMSRLEHICICIVYVYVCVCIYICICTLYLNISTYNIYHVHNISIDVSNAFRHLHAYMQTYLFTCSYVNIYAFLYTYTICIHAHAYTYIYMHMYTRTKYIEYRHTLYTILYLDIYTYAAYSIYIIYLCIQRISPPACTHADIPAYKCSYI